MEARSKFTSADMAKLVIAGLRLLSGDVIGAAKQIYKYRRVIAGIILGCFLFVVIIGALIISLPILIIKTIVPEPLQDIAIFAYKVLVKLVNFIGDVIKVISDAINSVIQFFFGEPTSTEKKSEVSGQVQIDPIPVLIIYNVKYGTGYFDQDNIDEQKFKQIAELFIQYSQSRSTQMKEVVEEIRKKHPTLPDEEIVEFAKKTIAEETLHIAITNNSFNQVLESGDLGLSPPQKVIATNMYEIYLENPSYFTGASGEPTAFDEMSKEIIQQKLIDAPTINRSDVLAAAQSILDDVPYFWGGKSSVIGRDPDWATWDEIGWDSTKLKKVTAPGSSSTGTMRPYGLDCSGFIAWVYNNAGFDDLTFGGTVYQWAHSYPISESELQPGDLAFENLGSNNNNHVGIFVERDSSGENQYIHSAPYISQVTNHTGVTKDNYKRFRYFRRVIVNFR